jgi:general secretion pathway protein J
MTSSRGFTLVEVMVAIAVFSLIMLTTVAGFRTLGNTASTIDRMTSRSDELRSVSAFLRDALENAVVGAASGGNDALTFGGSGASAGPASYFRVVDNALEWRAKVLFGEAYGGSYFVRLARRDDDLVLQWQDPRGQTEPGSWDDAPQRQVLEGLEELEIWTRMDATSPWLQEEVNRETPSHVKLVVKAGGRYWPDLIMTVQR